MSDRIAVMHNGLIERFDTPRELFERPKTPFVADLLGAAHFLPAASSSTPTSTPASASTTVAAC
ncbi:hypothetical protein OHN37_38380 [Streptomyces sp. NBC_00485]|uniref:hypothetical protein n=1 Tax=unclassified Streptomyces TaxID=2593676 RepID=UPI002E17F774